MTANCFSSESEKIRGVWSLMDSHLMMIKCHFSKGISTHHLRILMANYEDYLTGNFRKLSSVCC